MKINIKTTNIDLTDAIKNYIDKKIGGLKRFLKSYDPNTIEIYVEVGKPSKHHRSGNIFYAEADIIIAGMHLRSNAKTQDIYASIDEVKAELQREIKKVKEKQITKQRRRARSLKKSRALSPYSRFRQK